MQDNVTIYKIEEKKMLTSKSMRSNRSWILRRYMYTWIAMLIAQAVALARGECISTHKPNEEVYYVEEI